VTQDSSLGLPAQTDSLRQASSPQARLVARSFLAVLGILLAGYMFLGRGFAHIGIGPIYIGDWVLLLGMAAAAFVMFRAGVRAPITWIVALLVAFAALGAVRTIPYIGTYGLNALRDGVLWGYAGFALIVYLLVDREVLLRALRLYGWVVPIFALWLPISWNLFAAASADIDPKRPGSFVPLVFFKGGDMAVHVVGVIAFLVLGAAAVWSGRAFLWRMLICLPLLWTAFVAGTSNRGALVTATLGIVVVALLAPRWRSWLPLLAATLVFAMALTVQSVVAQIGEPQPTGMAEPTLIPSSSPTPSPSAEPDSSSPRGPSAPSASAPPDDTPAGSPPSAPLPGQALVISNSDFEVGPTDDGTILGWSPRLGSSVATGGTFSYNIVEGGAYRGARFASIRNLLKPYQATLTSSLISFKPGEDIAVSVWVKAIAARPTLEIYVNWFDQSGKLISSEFLNILRTDGLRTWQECAGALTAPPRTARAQILLYEASGRATIGIDQVTARAGDFIPEPIPPKGRPATLGQMIENFLSIFGSSPEPGLEGSKQFRLAWWGEIVNYTVFGDYFWTGKGFGVNLADADGFQSTVDHSLRSPHNSNMTVLARMGVPGVILWLLLQGLFGIGLLRATLAFRRAGEAHLALIGGLVLAYWLAMMVDTSFDPYLEGPQGGIWFWTIFGLGLVVMRIAPRRRVTT
jgi:hypothetical protein